MPNKDRSPFNYRLFLKDISDDDLTFKFGLYLIIFFGVFVALIAFYLVSYYCCGGKSGFINSEEGERKGRNKMLLFHYEQKKWPEKSRSKTLKIDEIKQQENQIRTILATK